MRAGCGLLALLVTAVLICLLYRLSARSVTNTDGNTPQSRQAASAGVTSSEVNDEMKSEVSDALRR